MSPCGFLLRHNADVITFLFYYVLCDNDLAYWVPICKYKYNYPNSLDNIFTDKKAEAVYTAIEAEKVCFEAAVELKELAIQTIY